MIPLKMYLVGPMSTCGLGAWAHCTERMSEIMSFLEQSWVGSPLLQGFKWELSIDAVFVTTCLLLAWQLLGGSARSIWKLRNLHQIRLQSSWRYTMLYAAMITAACVAGLSLTQKKALRKAFASTPVDASTLRCGVSTDRVMVAHVVL